MNNKVKNENTNEINSININQNINFEKELDDLIKYGKWELSLISSLKSEKLSKKNLLLIDKDWLLNWKQISGYNHIKNQIFQYLINIQKNKNDNKLISEEANKLKNIWNNAKMKYNIDISNIEDIPEIDNKKYLMRINNNKTLIKAQENFDIISNDIFDVFKKYLDKTSSIKVGGLFHKKKLLLPFNYNDKNVGHIFINMIYIMNNKNEFGEILFEFPKLKINIIEKIRKEISNKNITEFIKDNKETEGNIKEYIFHDEEGTQYIYKALFKNKKNQLFSKKESNEIKETKEKNEINNIDMLDIKDILNFDINNLTTEQIEEKIRQIEEETLKQIEIENNLNEQENLLLQGNKNNLYNIEYNKYETKIKQIESKINNINKEIKLCEEKEKENIYIIKLEEIKKKENKLKNDEKDLDKREKELYIDDKNNQEKKKELLNKQEEINQKEILLKEKEDLENERIEKELEDEINELENQVTLTEKNKKNMDIVDEAEEDNNSLNEHQNNYIHKNSSDNSSINKNKFTKRNSHQINSPFQKLNKLNNSINNNIPKLERYNSQNEENINKERMSLPNFNLKNKLFISHGINEIQEKIILDKDNISLGLKKMNPVNLNSIIQCFAHFKEIVEGMLNLEKNNFFKNGGGGAQSKEFLNLIKKLFSPEQDDIYSLTDFWKLIISEDNKNQNLKNKLYVDSKYLIDFFIKKLHKELNTKKISTNAINNVYESQNEKEALCKYLEEFTKNNNSLISKNFYGLIKHKIICQACKTERYKFELYTYLSFNLSQVKNFILKEDKQNKQKNNKFILKLEDCFDFYNKPEYLVGDEGLYCKKCKAKSNTTVLKSIYSSHPIIPIIFERDVNDKLNKDKIDFPEELDLSKYIEYKNSSKHFYLCGVVTNFGYSNNFGKFEAFCRMEKNVNWINFNDEQVSQSNWEDVHNNGIQYVLFYHKI